MSGTTAGVSYEKECRMKKIILFLVIIAQIAVPAFMLYRYESTLKGGDLYFFNVRPIDPYSPFRGRYVHLNFEDQFAPYNGSEELTYGSFVYATLSKNDDGKTELTEIFTDKPNGNNHLKVKFFNNYGVSEQPDNFHKVRFIFDRYYSAESKALKIEHAVANNRGTSGVEESAKVKAAVRIKDGLGVIEELYIGELTIHEYLAKKENRANEALGE